MTVTYVDEHYLAVYSCEQRNADGTCEVRSTFSTIFSRSLDPIADADKDALAAAVVASCVQPGAYVAVEHEQGQWAMIEVSGG
jgi:hypothetical protein